MVYSPIVMDHFQHPRNVGVLDTTLHQVGAARVGSVEQGAVMQVHLLLGTDGMLERACFKAYGCACTIAAGSVLVSQLQGLSLEQAYAFVQGPWAQPLALPAIKLHSAMLASEAVRAALDNWQEKQGVTL